MNSLPLPITFSDAGQMQTYYALIESQIEHIAARYGEPTLRDSIKIRLDNKTYTMEILSAGAAVKGSKRENAINEVLARFEAIFDI